MKIYKTLLLATLLTWTNLSAETSESEQPTLFESLELLIQKASQKPEKSTVKEQDFEAELSSPVEFSLEDETEDEDAPEEES